MSDAGNGGAVRQQRGRTVLGRAVRSCVPRKASDSAFDQSNWNEIWADEPASGLKTRFQGKDKGS